MENLSDMYYLIRFIVGRIFVYLRDTILHELPWFAEEIDDLDSSENKARAHPFTRRAIADFVAFVTICVFFVSFVFLSTKCTKDDEDNYNSSPRPVTPESEGEPLELVEEDDYPISPTPLETECGNPWGDTTIAEDDPESTFTSRKFGPRDRIEYEEKNRSSRSSIFDIRASHSQSTQTNQRILKRASKNRDWLIRRTRSGHIYGKYPL